MNATQLSTAELDYVKETTAAPSGEPWERFIESCLDWVNDWIQANEVALSNSAIPATQAIVFVFCEAPALERTSLGKLGTKQDFVFRKAVSQDTQGVILCNENFHQMIRISPGFASIDEALAIASQTLSSQRTFVVLSLAQRRMFVHRKGDDVTRWSDSLTPVELRFLDAPLSALRIENDIRTYHRANFEHPSSSIAQMLWKGRAFPYQLHPLPEQRIQGYLLTELSASYKHLRGLVDEEHRGRAGRCDLKVTWPTPRGAHHYATTMLELKVLIQAEGPKKHRKWMLSGITQADSYRQVDTEAVYACIFDARKDKSDQMVDLDAVAIAKDVRLRRYPMEAPLPAVGATSPKVKASPAAKKVTKKQAKRSSALGRKKSAS